MLQSAYDAVRQFQTNFSKCTTIQEVQGLAKSLDVRFSVEITSSTVWLLNWNLSSNKFSGSLEIGLKPTISCNGKSFSVSSQTMRIESPEVSWSEIELKILEHLRGLGKIATSPY